MIYNVNQSNVAVNNQRHYYIISYTDTMQVYTK